MGRFTGPAEVWNFTQVDSDVGCVGMEAVCDTGKAHYFIGDDDIYAFDGVQKCARLAAACYVIGSWTCAIQSRCTRA